MKRSIILPILATVSFAISGALPSVAADSCHATTATCIKVCEAHLKQQQKKHGNAKVIKALKDCITACKARNAHKIGDKECAEKCSTCATVCEESKDPSLKDCVTECQSCGSCCSKS